MGMKPIYKHKAEAQARCRERHAPNGDDPVVDPCVGCWNDQLLLVHIDVLQWVAQIAEAKSSALSENLRWVAEAFEESLGAHEDLKSSIIDYMKAMSEEK